MNWSASFPKRTSPLTAFSVTLTQALTSRNSGVPLYLTESFPMSVPIQGTGRIPPRVTVMASKNEYYQRIIASLQADIKSQNSAISDLKLTVQRQQKEIESLKASQGVLQQFSEPQQKRIATEHLLLAVKRVCDETILANYEKLPTFFADRHEFEGDRKSSEQKFLIADTFSDYRKSLEKRLKFIEEKLGSYCSLLTIHLHDNNGNNESKRYFNLDAIIRAFKNENLQWLKPIIVCLSICSLALYLISTITT